VILQSAMRAGSRCVIAIDGPAASGKSSVARELAARLGFVYVNSGAIYRAVTWHVLAHGVNPADPETVAQLAENSAIECRMVDGASRVAIEQVDPAAHLRDPEVNREVSRVSAIPRIRKIVDEKLHDCARDHDLVVEGRDIGSVVFPDTPYKFYIDASPEVRMRRRAAEGQRDPIALRDQADSSRPAAPLIIAEDALVIDSSHLTIDGVVGEIIGRLKMKGLLTPA
jgi:cytidylate kinase